MAAHPVRKDGATRFDKGKRPRAKRVKAKPPLAILIDDLRAIGKPVPAEEWAKLPEDFNENLDHYLYGSPKKPISRKRAL